MKKQDPLRSLYNEIQRDSEYRGRRMGTVFVPGTGPVPPEVVLVGEAPGREEELRKEPFVGAAGRNLNVLLHSIGLSRKDVFITNLVKYRPLTASGGNRKPDAGESRRALPYLRRELEILDAKVVVCLGMAPAAALLGDGRLKMSEANGKRFERDSLSIFVTYHPSPLNYNMPGKREAMEHAFRKLGELMGRRG